MNLIDPYQLKKILSPLGSVAVVGNAPTVLNTAHGKLIDQQDLVVRFNHARVDGYETWVGSRTDLLCCHSHHTPETTPPIEDLAPKAVVCFLTRKDRPFSLKRFEAWVKDTPVFYTLAPDVLPQTEERSMPLTTGTYALAMIEWLFEVREIFATGFNFFQSTGSNGHYWDSTPQPGPKFHDLKKEKRAFLTILSRMGGRLVSEEEITSERPLGKKIAGRVAWKMIEAGMLLRHYAETPSLVSSDQIQS